MSELEAWFREGLPLEAHVRSHAVEEARRRAERLGLSEADYARRLHQDPVERESVVQHAVPPESWLFRQAPAFECLRAWLARHGPGPVRLASLGCARGAEPYSLAVTALAAGHASDTARVIAVDWNRTHLADVLRGTVPPLAQRSAIPAWAQDAFTADGQGRLSVDPRALAMIETVHGDVRSVPLAGPFDVVFCRNMAIYLDASSRERLGRRLRDLVRPGGLLCVGHADPISLHVDGFAGLGVEGAFAFRRVDTRGADAATPAEARTERDARPHHVPAERPSMSSSRPEAVADLERVADEGRLEEAHRRITDLLRLEPVSVDGWWLAGSIALGRHRPDEAERCFTKVVYLDPMHRLALLQLSALAERRHDPVQADRYRLRVSRTEGADPLA
jgi:chemotaxis protein methyltransferase WspC